MNLDLDSDSSSADLTPRRGQIDLSIVDVVSSYDDQSNFQSLPSDVYEEKEVYEKTEKKQQQEDNDKPTSGRKKRGSSLASRRQTQQHQQSLHEETQQESQVVRTPPSANPLRHYRLVKLANAFFIIASVLFFWASWLESTEYSNNTRSITFLSNDSASASRPRSGYHLKLSSSIDTYITKQMILMLVSTFCLLQVGIINLVRTPLEKFHFFQIAAGLFGLVSSMFWESTSILSDISYFFFVHAMTGQALMLLHYHYRTLIQPFKSELRQQQRQGQLSSSNNNNIHSRKSPRPLSPLSRALRKREGHFELDSQNGNPSGIVNSTEYEERGRDYSSGNAFGLPDSDGNSLSEEPIFSLEEDDDLESNPRDGNRPLQRPHKETLRYPTSDDESVASHRVEPEHDAIKEHVVQSYLRFGIIFGIADVFFVIGSLLETAMTYLTILVINNENDIDNDDAEVTTKEDSTWTKVARVLNLVPGVLWFIYAWVTMMNTILLRRHVNNIKT